MRTGPRAHRAPNRKMRAADNRLMLYCILKTSCSVTGLPLARPSCESRPNAAQGMASTMRPTKMDRASVGETATVAAPRK